MKYFFKAPLDAGKSRKKWLKYLLLGASIIAAIYIAFMGFYFVTSEPGFCNLCHQMKPYVNSWSSLPHKNVKCMYCHEFRGVFGKLDSKARGLNDVYLQLTGQYSIIFKAKVFEHNCASCHLGDYLNYPNTVRMSKRHHRLIKENRSCIKCHREPGHKLGLFSDKKFR